MSTVLLALALGLPATPSGDGDWPWFLGPERNGKAHVPGVSFDWPEGGPAVSWKVAIGSGYGGVAARDGEVFLLDREVGSMDMLRVFDLESGEENWATEYEAPGRLNFPGSRTVPTVLEDYVYTCGGFGHVTCFDRKSHEIVWNINVEELYDGEMPLFGWSNSPLVVDDLVIVAAMGEFVGLVALDRFTGEEVWITDSVGYSHSTPTLVDLHGEPQVLFMSTRAQGSGQDRAAAMMVSSFAPGDGSLLWRHSTTLTRLPIPGPVQLDDERLFLTGGYRGGSTLLHVAKDGGDYAFDEVFHIDRGAQIHVPILHEDHLYTLVNENWNNNTRQMRQEGGLLCLDLEGNEVWRTGAEPFFGRGNAVLIGEHLVIQDGFTGVLRVARATPEGYEQVAEANVFGTDGRSDGQMWAPMAVADGRLLLRSQDELLCVDLLAGGAGGSE